jgi:hypothetical protein
LSIGTINLQQQNHTNKHTEKDYFFGAILKKYIKHQLDRSIKREDLTGGMVGWNQLHGVMLLQPIHCIHHIRAPTWGYDIEESVQ